MNPARQLSSDALDAYEACAFAYDDLTAHHDFELWLGNLLPQLERHGLRGRCLLDVACGTGNSFMPMIGRGWDVLGCDCSPKMIERAREKAGDRACLEVADMRCLPEFGRFDLVWALTDPLNYMLDVEELALAFDGMRRNLAPGGLLVFDLNTLRMFRTEFAEVDVMESECRTLIWEGRAASDVSSGALCEARLTVESAGRKKEPPSVHRQRHFPAKEVIDVLAHCGLDCLDVFGHIEDAIFQQPLDELGHLKAIYIACRAD